MVTCTLKKDNKQLKGANAASLGAMKPTSGFMDTKEGIAMADLTVSCNFIDNTWVLESILDCLPHGQGNQRDPSS
jgi:hypothetical protein